ncbi:baculoviral IAP repeat-containing protein 2-like isoform X2 [Physella acuta]|uniref:baculoviral IAP repeat-containing protein 2-like isoform X2 n=1 Tax=Physella acuta TaxID=109671 RepID=UPI0027DE508A|nr:baculoviral IAP repeat-containing protein 2-like isoform X2 [Physella acuta]
MDEWNTEYNSLLSRLATFRRAVTGAIGDVYVSELADAGFFFSTQHSTIICIGCRKTHAISHFTSDPADRQYHERNCVYASQVTGFGDQLVRANVEATSDSRENNYNDVQNRIYSDSSSRPNPTQVVQETLRPVAQAQDTRAYSHPSNPAYITLKKRLESFTQWPSTHIHQPADLAAAGFFYAGYADCVRCYQCGLGLKSWKPGDDIHEQHKKFRPHCPFLQLHIRSREQQADEPEENTNSLESSSSPDVLQPNGSDPLQTPSLPTPGTSTSPPTPATTQTATSTGAAHSAPAENIKVALLEKENRALQKQLTCRVCKQAPIKDLFLPCGDLYACEECSKSLSHCPACNKQILATVKTYFV